MSEEFWIDEGGRVSGPISRDTLEARICAGAIQPDTWISRDNKNFAPAGEIYEAGVFGAPLGKSDSSVPKAVAPQIEATATQKKTFPCPTCEKEISKQAESCPHCGHKLKVTGGAFDPKNPIHLAGIVGCLLLVLLFAGPTLLASMWYLVVGR